MVQENEERSIPDGGDLVCRDLKFVISVGIRNKERNGKFFSVKRCWSNRQKTMQEKLEMRFLIAKSQAKTKLIIKIVFVRLLT